MSWSEHLKRAKGLIKASKPMHALKELDKALGVGGDQEHAVYECRSAIYEQQGKYKSALLDAKNIIQLAPARWQGYARASRLFFHARKLDEATRMADLALARLDGQDAAVQRQKLAQIKSQADQYRRQRLNHFANLPVELVATIFELVALEAPHQQVLTIWAVCKHWQSVALGTPRLWSTLIVKREQQVRIAQRWIERAKGMISRLVLGPLDSRTTSLSLDGLRWDRLRVCLLDGHDITPYIGGKSQLHRLSGLEQLEIYHTAGQCDHLIAIPVEKSKLVDARWTWSALCTHQQRLTSLEVDTPFAMPTIEEIWLVLETNPLLEVFAVTLFPGPWHAMPVMPALTMPHLHTLHLSRTPWFARLFEFVTMPSLRIVRLSHLRTTGLSLLAQKQPQLHHLSAENSLFTSSEFISLLQISPALHTLELTLQIQAEAVMTALATTHPPLCPALSTIDISNCDVKTVPIIKLLQTRNAEGRPEVAKIRHLTADRCPSIEAQAIPWITSQVERFSCVYLDKKSASWKR
ncbi:hypothetical protein C8F01DRAFT_527514 [Mycena amicta]|nr:hypothetical protein C8F01DRAFT_527514 [Mycena amicta]